MNRSLLAALFAQLAMVLLSSQALAQESPHRLGIDFTLGAIDDGGEIDTEQLNDLATTDVTISYRYQLSKNFSMGLGYLSGDSDNFDFLTDIFTDSRLEYTGLMLGAGVEFPIFQRASLYLDLHGIEYDYEIIDDNLVAFAEDGTDFVISAGWRYGFDNGVGVNFGYEYLQLGDNIDIASVGLGLSYRF